MASVWLSFHPLIVKSPYLHDSILGQAVFYQVLDISTTAIWSNVALDGQYNVAKYMVARVFGDVAFRVALGSSAFPNSTEANDTTTAATYVPADTIQLFHMKRGDLVACAPLNYNP